LVDIAVDELPGDLPLIADMVDALALHLKKVLRG